MTKKDIFEKIFPNKFFLDQDDIPSIESYLQKHHFISENERIVDTEIPGAGNMNCVVRVRSNSRSFIMKQARPWVEKYPSILAPIERVFMEASYYSYCSNHRFLAKQSPEVLWFDASNFLMILDDLGQLEDLSVIYSPEQALTNESIVNLARYLSSLHQIQVDDFPDNLEMRKLNHEHIFHLPFKKNNGIALDEIQDGLQQLTDVIHRATDVKSIVEVCGEIYLSKGNSLIHGDFYPGSIMLRENKIFVLDPEFCFVGPAEFDLGVFMAHLYIAGEDVTKIKLFLSSYKNRFDRNLSRAFAGIEIIRRLLGVAQLPLTSSVAEKERLIDIGLKLIQFYGNDS